MKRRVAFYSIIVLLWGACLPVEAGSIVSWDDAHQRGGDLYTGGTGAWAYSALEAGLLARGHVVLPGLSTLSSSSLTGVDLFFHGTSSYMLTAAEATALSQFVQNGGCVIVEADTYSEEQQSANSLLTALGLGTPVSGSPTGNQSATAGLFTLDTTWATVGPLGDLRGSTFGGSFSSAVDVGTGTLAGMNDTVPMMVEFQPYGTSGGRVLAVGDAFGFNIFQLAGQSYYNPNNQAAYLNFLENQAGTPVTIPAPGAILLGAIGASLVGWLRRRRTL